MAYTPRRRPGPTAAYQQTRAAILTASNVCYICGETGADSTDHVIPWAKGGTDDPANLRPAHYDVPNSKGIKCNRAKSDKDADLRLTTTRDW